VVVVVVVVVEVVFGVGVVRSLPLSLALNNRK
jgi:hypothetical protein